MQRLPHCQKALLAGPNILLQPFLTDYAWLGVIAIDLSPVGKMRDYMKFEVYI
uniref:Uncharacterized protein n=1 Tax=Anguilla anguilla TaxID=7936 RepID=A0A0E9VHW4_ANGAN